MWGALAAVGGSLLGGVLKNDAARTQAHEAQDFSAAQYASRWQTTTADMKAAGLNPMLAYTQGVGNSPQGQQADVSDVITPAVQAVQQNRMTTAQVANVEADTENKKAQADLIAGQAAQAWSSAHQGYANVGLINKQADKIVEEIKNIPLEGERLKRAAELLYQQANSEFQGQLNAVEQRSVIQATARKVIAETGLINLDIDAAKAFDNLGNEAKQLRPVIEMIKGLIHIRNSK